MFTGLVQRIYPKTRQMEKMPGARFQERGYGASLSLKPHHLHSTLIFTNSEALQISLLRVFITHLQLSSLPRKSDYGTGSFRTLITRCLIFLVTSSHPKALWRPQLKSFHYFKLRHGHKGLVKENKRHSHHSGNSQDFRSSVLGTGEKRSNIFLKSHDSSHYALILRSFSF